MNADKVHQERNFHIFYQLTKAGSKALKRRLNLTAAEDYTYGTFQTITLEALREKRM